MNYSELKKGDRVRYKGDLPGFDGHVGEVAYTPDDSFVYVTWDELPVGAWWNQTCYIKDESLEPEFHTGGFIPSAEAKVFGGEKVIPSALLEAHELVVGGERNEDYGHPLDDFSKTAEIWSKILKTDVTPEQVALCMIGVKVSRLCNDITKRDSWVDIAGYVECWQRIQNKKEGLE